VLAYFAEVANSAEVWVLIGGKIPEGDIAFKQAIDLSGAADADTVGKDEDFQQQDGMIGRASPAIIPRLWIEWLKAPFAVEVVDGVINVPFETLFFDPVTEVFWKEMLLVLIIFNKIMCNWYILDTQTYSN